MQMYDAASDDKSPKTAMLGKRPMTYDASDDKSQKGTSPMQLFDIAMAEKSRGCRGGKIRTFKSRPRPSSSNQKISSFNDPRLRLGVANKPSFPKIYAQSNKRNGAVPSNVVDR